MKWLFKLLFKLKSKWFKEPRITTYGELYYNWQLATKVYQLAMQFARDWKSKLSKLFTFALRSWFFDLYYESCTYEEIQKVITKFRNQMLSHLHYIPENFDCDDFACAFKAFATMELMRNSVGIAIGAVYDQNGQLLGYHAWNIVILTGGSLMYIEPQSGQIFLPPSVNGSTYDIMSVIW